MKRALHHILHIEGRHHLPGRCRAGPTTTSRAERSSACSSRPCVVVGAEPAVRRRRGAGRASLWARSRPCVVVGAEPAMRRPAGLLDLRRRCAAARRGVRGVLRRASGAQFFIARRGRGSGRRSTAPTTAWSRVPRRAARRPLTASRRTSPRRPRAVLLRCSAFFHQVGINVRRRRARRYVAATPPRRAVPGHAQAGRAMLKLVLPHETENTTVYRYLIRSSGWAS